MIEIEKFVETWHFWQISTVCLDLDQQLVNLIIFRLRFLNLSRFFIQKYLEKYQLILKISTNLENLENLDSLDENLDAA
jgi:hypothetical protein